MKSKREDAERFSLARWSQRKLESAKTRTAPTDEATLHIRGPAADAASPATAPSAPAPEVTATIAVAGAAPAPVELPPVESLSFDSDFTAFLRPEVDADLRRAALKRLFRDPRFNVMDGLDTYIDDYTKPDPIPPDMLAELVKRFDLTKPPIADRNRAAAESGAAALPPAQALPRVEVAIATGEPPRQAEPIAPARTRPSAASDDPSNASEQAPAPAGPAPTSSEQNSTR